MKRIAIALLLLICMSALASAQTEGYAYFAPGQLRGNGVTAAFFHFGGGAKYFTEKRVGLGADLGLWGPKSGFSDAYGGNFSLNGYYKLDLGLDKIDPTLTLGYTRSFGHESGANWVNLGGGIDYWFKEKMALMLEFRDYLKRIDTGTVTFKRGVTITVWEIRVGLAFR
jgi:hypothetical protein